mgnify:FL=1
MVVIGVQHNELIVKRVRDGRETTLSRSETESTHPFLKIKVSNGCMLTFFHSPDGKSWYRVNDTPLDGSFLVRWDRVARPGLIHRGRTNEPAVFNYFNLNHIH